jgi:hypothetical protein
MSRGILTSNVGLQALADGGGTVDGGVGEDAPVPDRCPNDAPCPQCTSHGASIMLQQCSGTRPVSGTAPETPSRSDDGADANAPAVAAEVEAAAARGVGGELFLRVHWVAVPEALRARRGNRRRSTVAHAGRSRPAGAGGVAAHGSAERGRPLPGAPISLMIEAPWVHATSECQRLRRPPRLNNLL